MRFYPIIVFILNFDYWKDTFVSCTIIETELCGPETVINLQPTGEASSITILLNPKDHKKICRVNITAPISHAVNMQWHQEHEEEENHSVDSSPCPLSVFLPEDKTRAVWKGNPCMKDNLPEVDLLTPSLKLAWNPPRFGIHSRGRKLVITAVGQDEVCIQKGQHICMRIGWKPMLCVSNELICDGNLNCPRGSSRSDEDEALCRDHQTGHNTWKQLAEEVIKKLPSDIVNTSWLQKNNNTEFENHPDVNLMNWKDIKAHEVTSTPPDHYHHHDTGDSVSAAIAHYGTWGYLMLAMLIVGTILMFCGLWECCFRKPKPHLEVQPPSPSTTVLIINRTQDSSSVHPPNYEELDQPPSYTTLFPSTKTEVENVIRADTISCREESSNYAYSSACDSSDEHSDTYVSLEDISNRFCNSSVNAEQENVNERRASPIFCIVTSL